MAVWVALFIAALGVLVAALTSSGGHDAVSGQQKPPPKTSTTSPPSTTTTTSAPTTTLPLPSAPQPSAANAAGALITYWAAGSQPKALSVATPQAVSALFANTYHNGLVTDRGCNSGTTVVTCSYGPPGGSSPTDPLYSLTVEKEPTGGWYVSTVAVEG